MSGGNAGVFPVAAPRSADECCRATGLAYRVFGDPARQIRAVCAPENAAAGTLSFVSGSAQALGERIAAASANAVIVGRDFGQAEALAADRTIVAVDDPMLFFIRCVEWLFPAGRPPGIHPGAFVDPGAQLGEGCRIEAGAVVDAGCMIGPGATLESGVRVHGCVRIGCNALVQANSVIGATGMAFGREAGGAYRPFPHLGGVRIGDDVQIGPNTTIVRGMLKDTEIGPGTKIGNQVNVGHNVSIGRHCFISAGATLCGSVVLEDSCWIAPGAVILNHVRIGRGGRVGLGAVVTRDVGPGVLVAGHPARVVPGSAPANNEASENP